MDNINIYIEFTDLESFIKVLNLINLSNYKIISLYIIFYKSFSFCTLKKLNESVDKVLLKKEILISKNIINDSTKKNRKYIYNFCKKNNITLLNNNPNTYCLPSDTLDFEKWMSGNACEFKTYYNDFFKSVLLGNKLSNCFNSSCLGRTIFITKNGDLAFCPQKVTSTIIGNIASCKDFRSVFDEDKFIEVLKNHIKKRNDCKIKCSLFNYCCGYCPLEKKDCCDLYKSTYDKTIYLISTITNKKPPLSNYNVDVKNAILKAIAFNKFCERENKNEQKT